MKKENNKPSHSNLKGVLIITAVIFVISNIIDIPLHHHKLQGNAVGIVGLEFAGSYNTFRLILDTWGPSGAIWAAISLSFDFLFIIAYVTAFHMSCLHFNERLQAHGLLKLAKFAILFSYAIFLAGVSDIIENILLIHALVDFTSMIHTLSDILNNSKITVLDNLIFYASLSAMFKFIIICSLIIFISIAYFCIAIHDRQAKKNQARVNA